MTPEKLLATLEKLGLDRIKETTNSFMACCPNHEERNPSWGISKSEPHPHGCFACGYSGTLLNLLVDKGKFTPEKARQLCKIHQSDLSFIDLISPKKQLPIIAKEKLYPYRLSNKAKNYLRTRGISKQIAKKLGCVYMPMTKRVLFPWYNDGQLHAVTGRLAFEPNDEGIAKTLPFFGSQKSKMLYLPNRKIDRGRFVLVEGEIDAAKVFAAGWENVGAIGHGKFSEGQKRLLLNSPAETICCFFDDDATGSRLQTETFEFFSGRKYLETIDYTYFREKFRTLKRKGKIDPAFLSPIEIRFALKNCVIRNANWPEL